MKESIDAGMIEITLTVRVPAGEMWMYKAYDALKNVGNAICMYPQYTDGKGESLSYLYEYTVKGER